LTIPVATIMRSVAASIGRMLGSSGDPPRQKVPYPRLSANFAASPASSSVTLRDEVQSPIWPSCFGSISEDFHIAADGPSDETTRQLSIGEGGIRVAPVICGMTIATSSTKHQLHSSPGSSDRINGCEAAAACALA
jgi:hypothetical protein